MDDQAIGAMDADSVALVAARIRPAWPQRASKADPVKPDLRLASRDPYALRYAALLALVVAALFGSFLADWLSGRHDTGHGAGWARTNVGRLGGTAALYRPSNAVSRRSDGPDTYGSAKAAASR